MNGPQEFAQGMKMGKQKLGIGNQRMSARTVITACAVVCWLLIVLGVAGIVWIYSATSVVPIATIDFPDNEIEFKIQAESDMDIKSDWVYVYVHQGNSEQTQGELVTTEKRLVATSPGTYVSKDKRYCLALWTLPADRKLFIVFDRKQKDVLCAEFPYDREIWRGHPSDWLTEWEPKYEILREEFPALPQLEWNQKE